MVRPLRKVFPIVFVSFLVTADCLGETHAAAANISLQTIIDLAHKERSVREKAAETVGSLWEVSFVPIILEMLLAIQSEGPRKRDLWELLEKKTGKRLKRDVYVWLHWIWHEDFEMHPAYPAFKADLYSNVDQRFYWWFFPGMKHTIRLDEILWGGVAVDGIPPLEHPNFVEAEEARYLGGKNIVFGVFINGEARAYPKRILAWHELFNDTIGSVDVTCAYCTLCGAAVLYRQQIGEQRFSFGTSGFLYRSNKLMYDRQTRSLWFALEGVPVTGELVGQGLKLQRLPITTTTWKAWKALHPTTKVLSLDTGFERDYGEGVAYRAYFRTHDLMFPVPDRDNRLKNKQEIVALLIDGEPVAFDVRFLRKNSLYEDKTGGCAFVILTDRSGAARVYEAKQTKFAKWDKKKTLVDDRGGTWEVSEDALVGPTGMKLRRLPSHRAFWFGWYAQFPDSRLVR